MNTFLNIVINLVIIWLCALLVRWIINIIPVTGDPGKYIWIGTVIVACVFSIYVLTGSYYVIVR